jgi:hypothetical protein
MIPRPVPPYPVGLAAKRWAASGRSRFRIPAAEEHLAKSTGGWADADTLGLSAGLAVAGQA